MNAYYICAHFPVFTSQSGPQHLSVGAGTAVLSSLYNAIAGCPANCTDFIFDFFFFLEEEKKSVRTLSSHTRSSIYGVLMSVSRSYRHYDTYICCTYTDLYGQSPQNRDEFQKEKQRIKCVHSSSKKKMYI